MLRAHTALVPPPPGVPSVLVWGDPDRLQGRLAPFAHEVRAVRFVPAAIEMAFPLTPWGVVELFRENYGPTTVRPFATLDAEGRATLSHDLLQLWSRFAHGSDGFTRARAEYLEVWIELK